MKSRFVDFSKSWCVFPIDLLSYWIWFKCLGHVYPFKINLLRGMTKKIDLELALYRKIAWFRISQWFPICQGPVTKTGEVYPTNSGSVGWRLIAYNIFNMHFILSCRYISSSTLIIEGRFTAPSFGNRLPWIQYLLI